MKTPENGLQRQVEAIKSALQSFGRKYLGIGRRVTPQGLQHLHDSLMEDAELELNYVVLIIGSCLIATLGLLSNSAAVIIGAMLVAPLMQPIRALAFGILEGDVELIQTAFKSLLVGTAIAIGLSWLLSLSSGFAEFGSEVLGRSRPTILDMGIAIAAGGISGYAKVEPKLSSTLAGTAIAVALMPPVCVVGIGIAQGWALNNWALSQGAGLLYVTNLIGITLACMLIFLLTGYASVHQARRPLSVTLALTGVLLLPLGFSLIDLVRQNQLESGVKQTLLRETETFKGLRLVETRTNWLSNPPEVRLTVYAVQPVSPRQVQLLEDFLARRLGRRFTLIFEVSAVQEVNREGILINTQEELGNWQDSQP
ncbi:MAG: DUF389 domain-containing protein [Leptolyngbyaceae cyanobacterium SM1_1_3]|nr:DUF389 domain-containing protein [Leptolyngbyaceae cyanobacterium SM1_1_3]NJN04032.1 DUF389 domain-containing protein [Leptolyngbyaceae cyanobacterium RM1_1_2]